MMKNKTATKSPFDAIVFAGGGCRCLWQAGFLTVASPALSLAPAQVAAASAGAAIACMFYAGRTEFSLRTFKEATAKNKKNFYFSNIYRGAPVFPHYGMYRALMLETMDGPAMKRLKQGPDIRILYSRPPARLGPRLATFTGIMAYLIDKHFSKAVHPSLPSKLGFTPVTESARDCDTAEDLADLVLASSCTPPFTPIMRRGGKTSLDGGLIDNVPLGALSSRDGNVLVLLTRQYVEKAIPAVQGRVYVQPSRPSPIAKWDYANPRGLQEVFDLGLRDGEMFAKSFIEGAGVQGIEKR